MRTAPSPEQADVRAEAVKAGGPRRSVLIFIVVTAFFLAGCGISVYAAYQRHQDLLKVANARFEAQTDLLEEALIERFDKPIQALKGLSALHTLDQGFSRKRFRDYWAARGFRRDFPGVRGFGYIAHVASHELDTFVASERRDGATDFRIKTLGPTHERYIIKLIEPIEDNRSAMGLDIGSERVRRTAADEAVRSGLPTLSGVINLVQDGRQGPGFLLLLPTYRKDADLRTETQRIDNHLGFVYSPLVAEELFQPLMLNTLGQLHFDVEVRSPHDLPQWVFQSETHLLAEPSKGERAASPAARFSTNRHFLVAGLEFRLQTRSTANFEAAIDTQKPWQIGIGGVLFTTLLAIVFWLLASGRARAEARAQELASDRQRLAVVAERTSNSVIIADAEHRIVWVNQAFTALSGHRLDEVRGRKVSEVRGDIQDPQTLERIRTALQKGENLRIETVNRSRDGLIFWVDLDLQTLRDTNGLYQGYVAVERDITESKLSLEREQANAERLTAALRETEALMNTINAHAIVSEAGPDGRILRVNDAFCRTSGYSREELLGQDHRIVNSGRHERAFWQDLWRTIAAGQPWRGQICNRAKNGSLYWVDSIIAPFADASGRIEKYVSIRFDITQAREIEQELARERQRLTSTLEGTNVGTWEVNVITGENRIDARWAGMVGYSLKELLPITPEKWKALVHPVDEKIAQSRLMEYLHGRTGIFEMERRLKHKDGHWIWVLSRGIVSTRLPDGRVEWMSGTHMDVTERHMLYEQIEQRSQLMTAILDNIPGGLVAFDADLNLLVRNQQFSDMLGFPPSIFLPSPVTYESLIRYEAEHGEFGDGDVESIVARAIRNAKGATTANQFERVRPNGQILEVRRQPMVGGGLVMTLIDITKRRQTEIEARQADEMLRQAINTLDEAFVIYDAEDRLLMCNQRYRDTYPIAATVMKPGNTFEEIIRYGAERGEYVQAVGRVDEWVAERMRQHLSANTDLVQELGDGRFLRIVERKTADGFIVGFRIDISDLVRARLAAEDASKSKSQFLANMSHEIRTPMNAILGMLSLLHNTELSARQRDYVGKTEGAAKSLLALLNDILDFSKVEAGKMTLETAPFRIDHLLRDLSVILSSNTGSKNIEVLFDIDPSLPATLMGDSLRLKQVLINLGGNAIKFTEQGMVVLHIAVVERQASRVMLECSVSDTGIGIAPENLDRIFDGFSQAEASTTRRFGGTGLGLVISARLVGLMGGQLEVESEVGKGSRFHFRITLDVAHDETPLIDTPAPVELRELQVLVIDDNPVAQQVLRAMVEPLGWQAELASSGEEALKLIRQRITRGQRPYDAVFVDWQMPGMDGWETSLQIRKLLSDQRATILVMVTAHGREMLARRPANEQALLNGFLVKPVTPSMLLDAITEARQEQLDDPARPAVSADSARRLQGMRVLLVEDNKINQQVAQELLEREGAQVTLADNGALGVHAIAAADQPWDVVLMDIQMPVMDGYTATRKVRQELKLASLPIIAMTANAMEIDRQEAMAAGMNAHVGKPFNLDELVRTMLQHSGYTAPEAGVSAQPAPPSPPTAPLDATAPANAAQFDISSALERLGGNASVLMRVLQIFARDLPRQPQELATLLARAQGDEARRLLHTLKGTAATVGAHRLAAVAAEAEQRLSRGLVPAGDEAEAMLTSVRSAVNAVMADMESILRELRPAETGAGPAGSTLVDRAALQADLEKLMPLLRSSDLASLDVYAELRDRHGPSLPEELKALDEAMAGLDFSQAARQCEQLQQRYTV